MLHAAFQHHLQSSTHRLLELLHRLRQSQMRELQCAKGSGCGSSTDSTWSRHPHTDVMPVAQALACSRLPSGLKVNAPQTYSISSRDAAAAEHEAAAACDTPRIDEALRLSVASARC